MEHRALEKTERVDNVETVGRPKGEEKSNILNNVKNFFLEFGKSKKDNIENLNKDEAEPKTMKEEKNFKSFTPYEELSEKERSDINQKQQELSKEFRKKYSDNSTETQGDEPHGANGEVTLYEKFKIDKPIQKESDDQER